MSDPKIFYSAKIVKESVQPEESLGNEIQHPWGDNGDNILYWKRLQNKQAYHSRCLELRASCAVELGMDFDSDTIGLDVVNEYGENIQEVLKRVTLEYLHGNGYIEIVAGRGGKVEELYYMPAEEVWRMPRGSKEPFMYRSSIKGSPVYLPRFPNFNDDGRAILHLQRATNLNRHYGYPGWLGIIPEIELDWYTTLYNQKFFINSGVPDLAIIVEGGSFDKDIEELVSEFIANNFKGVDNSQRTLYLPINDNGVKVRFERIGLTMDKDGSFTKLRESCRDRIIAGHGCPPRLVGVMASGALGGQGEVTGQLKTFQETVNGPDQRYIADKLRPVFDMMGLPRFIGFQPIDTDSYEETTALYDSGLITKDEGREMHGYGPASEGGDEYKSSDTGEQLKGAIEKAISRRNRR